MVTCIHCGETDIDKFYPSHTKNGDYRCKKCSCEYQKEYVKEHRQEIRKYVNSWNHKNPEKAREVWNRAFDKWYELHKDKHYERRRIWIENNSKAGNASALARKYFPQRQICSIEGCYELGERHHRDYDKPLEIIWLCKIHHKAEHAIVK